MTDKLENATRKILNWSRDNRQSDVEIEFDNGDLAEDRIEVYERPSDIDFLIGEGRDNNLEFHPAI